MILLLLKLDEMSKEIISIGINKSELEIGVSEHNEEIITLTTEINDLKNQLEIIQESNKKRIQEYINKLSIVEEDKKILTENVTLLKVELQI